ncbi:hypothetical protein MSIBF_A50002 [groundwater metagenome]|uniref:Uncharacterized protein n=1 Tax=groundwater metagenome TaxID=717931 RepID=A0A098ECP3_9ZZZZ
MKKLIVISNDIYIRNFVQTGAFSEIEDSDTYYVASGTVRHLSELQNKKNYLGTVKEPKWRFILHRRVLFPLLTFANKNKSTSFEFRTHRFKYRERLIFNLLSSRFLKKPMIFITMILSGYNQRLYKIIKDLNPDIVIIPSSATDSLSIDATIICKKLNVISIHLINGWDNLSSKIVYPLTPDYLCVWGQQSVEHAEKIHGIPSKRVFPIGVPTFEHYFRSKEKSLKSHYAFEYALFAGCFVPFDEISALKILEEKIEKSNIKNFKIVYRPHPWRAFRSCFDEFKQEEFNHVVLDDQVKDNYLKSRSKIVEGKDFLPSLDYYPALLSNAKFVICPLSTMTLESAIFEKQVLVIAYDDGIHITSPHNLFRYEHFRGIENLYGIQISNTKSDFEKLFIFIYNNTMNLKTIHKTNVREQIKYYIYYDNNTYAERLKKVIQSILDSSKLRPDIFRT